MKLKALTIDLDPKALTFDTMRTLTDEFLKSNPKEGKKYWDCMAALRGPDVGLPDKDGIVKTALANGNSPDSEHARVQRKHNTSAIIRAHMFPGAAGCSAAQMNADPDAHIILPPKDLWDHFDKHVFKAAVVLGLPIQIGDQKPDTGPDLNYDHPYMVKVPGISTADHGSLNKKAILIYLGVDHGPVNKYMFKVRKTGEVFYFTSTEFDNMGCPWKEGAKLIVVQTFNSPDILLAAWTSSPTNKIVLGMDGKQHTVGILPVNTWELHTGVYTAISSPAQMDAIIHHYKDEMGALCHVNSKHTEFLIQIKPGDEATPPIYHLYKLIEPTIATKVALDAAKAKHIYELIADGQGKITEVELPEPKAGK